ncbi:epimerase [Acinetobacter venetianus]|uniref:NAD(P)-dependent oxidoreductase n=1 Tax=Acinetobacter TaxID=469 RepID=UPI00077585DE|nr:MULTISPECIES: NAD(P)H-binding protein [Acinetobacter]KXO80015.1 epimerase [Acinetobacter venetianus]MCU4473795.1 NAD(P)H-binding protein [Acinetobacter bereziniae]
MNIVLFSASGRAGKTILNELIQRGHQVTAIVRDKSRLSDLSVSQVQVVESDLVNMDAEQLSKIIQNTDAVISAFGPPSNDPRYVSDQNYTDQLVVVTEKLIEAVKISKAPRFVVVGGAGSLWFSPGITVLDSGYWPQPYVPIAKSHMKTLNILKNSNINWTYFSPPMMIELGKRTGKFKLGGDDLIKDEQGHSHISFEDYAIALVDEIENPKFERARFTIGY